MNASNVDDARLRYLDDSVLRLIGEYERRPPAAMAPQVQHLRGYVDQMLAGRQHPPQRQRLYGVGVRLCGLLGALALDLGMPAHAGAYGLEAFDLADASGTPDLQAWTRAVQSLIAYYAGDYHEALAYARDGQRRASRSPHRVRLAVNGEARALARLGDAYGVDEAVDRAFTMLADYPARDQVSTSMTLGPYCVARARANAATAYLALGRVTEVDRYGVPALAAFDAAGLRGPQALTRLDLATAALRSPDPDPDRASELAAQAMAVSASQRFESVAKRAREFVVAARPWAGRPAVREVAELVADWAPT
jgi:tetratricopeptide (TPR) repeat protein